VPKYKTYPHVVEAHQHDISKPEDTLQFIRSNVGYMKPEELVILPGGIISSASDRAILLDTDWVVVYYAGMGSSDFKFMTDFKFKQCYTLDE